MIDGRSAPTTLVSPGTAVDRLAGRYGASQIATNGYWMYRFAHRNRFTVLEAGDGPILESIRHGNTRLPPSPPNITPSGSRSTPIRTRSTHRHKTLHVMNGAATRGVIIAIVYEEAMDIDEFDNVLITSVGSRPSLHVQRVRDHEEAGQDEQALEQDS